MTQIEVSSEIGISQAQVSRLEKGALDHIKIKYEVLYIRTKIHAKLYPARIFLCVLCNNYEVTACLYLFTKIPSIKNTAASTAEDAKLSNADTGSTATLPVHLRFQRPRSHLE